MIWGSRGGLGSRNENKGGLISISGGLLSIGLKRMWGRIVPPSLAPTALLMKVAMKGGRLSKTSYSLA